MNPHKRHSFPKQNYVEKLPLLLYCNKYFTYIKKYVHIYNIYMFKYMFYKLFLYIYKSHVYIKINTFLLLPSTDSLNYKVQQRKSHENPLTQN